MADSSSNVDYNALGVAAFNAASAVSGAQLGYKQSKKLQKYQNKYNTKMWNLTNEYNSPIQQMQRLKAAGLNPALMYGGSGNSGVAQSAPNSADMRLPDYQQAAAQVGNAVTQYQQTKLTEAQINATNARTAKDTMQTALTKFNAQIAERNPWLNDTAYASIIDSLILGAQQKAADLQTSVIRSQDAALQLEERDMNMEWLRKNLKDVRDTDLSTRKQDLVNRQFQGRLYNLQGDQAAAGTQKIYREINYLEQKYDLGRYDIEIKKQIINSKEFQNDITKIQRDFLADGTISAGMYYEFIRELIMQVTDTGMKAATRKR